MGTLKRTSDLVLVIPCLIIATPFLFIIALLVKLTSPGPILHRRRVVGYLGKEFDAFKFRTMIPNADEYLKQHEDLLVRYQANIKLRDDPRITKIGRWLRKFSLDELPQLVNVFLGQMSLVGPRMISPAELAKYGEFAQKRLTVRPGITGLWQVSGRQETSYEVRVKLDMQYIEHWSLFLDFKILVMTIPAVLQMKGAY